MLDTVGAAVIWTRASAYSSSGAVFEVGEVGRILLHDSQRQKDLPVHVFYPIGAGPFPVIVFSHGASASGSTYLDLTRSWAAAGYVVLQPTHADSIKLRRQQGEHVGILRGLSDALQDAMANHAAAADRARDISLVFDSLDEVERSVSELQGKTDRGRMGVGGHSFGAMTALLVGGAVVSLAGSLPATYRDTRVRAIEVLSGPGDREKAGLSGHSWETLGLPMLTMTGSRDLGFGRHPPSWRKMPFDLSPAGDKFHVFIEGATHFSFVGAHLPAMLGARVGGAGPELDFQLDSDEHAGFLGCVPERRSERKGVAGFGRIGEDQP